MVKLSSFAFAPLMRVAISLERHTLGILFPLIRQFWLRTCLQFQHFMGYPEWSYLPEHQVIAMQDSSPLHRLRVFKEAIGRLHIQWQADHLPQSPDFNPIKGVWNLLKRRID